MGIFDSMKKRKDAKDRDPGGSGLEFHMAAEEGKPRKERRAALRVRMKGLEAAIVGLDRSLAVRDISVMGAGLVFKGKHIKAGKRFRVTLRQGQTVYAEAVTARTMRHEQGVLGVVWQDPDRHQSEGLHKIVLDAQKQQAEARKGKKELPDDIKNLKL